MVGDMVKTQIPHQHMILANSEKDSMRYWNTPTLQSMADDATISKKKFVLLAILEVYFASI